MKKKKRGSSLVLVVMVSAVLSILGTSMLAVTSNDYYRRVVETKKLQNLYEAESGLDTSYNVLAKTVESAVIYGNKAVEEFRKEVEGITNEELEAQQKKVFKKNFNYFIDTIAESAINQSKIVTTKKYEKDKEIQELNVGVGQNVLDVLYDNELIEVNKSNINEKIMLTATVTPDVKTGDLDNLDAENNSKFYVSITSNFSTDGESGAEPRTITAKYTIDVPEYQFYLDNTEVVIEIHPILDKTIAIDGDLSIQSNTEVVGDIYVKGNNNELNDFVYDKYKGGIKVSYDAADLGRTNTYSTNFTVTGDVITQKSVLIQNNSKFNSIGNIYASNVHIGKLAAGDSITSKSSVISKPNSKDTDGIYLSNDLSINGDEINVEINNFYGINDVGLNSNSKNIVTAQDKATNSSSIIVNSDNFGQLTIKNRAYIWGTAYINTADKYQTGESVAVKGNYVAYSDSLGKNVEFKYDEPLQLLSKIDGKEANVFDKADHIKEYFEENKDSSGNKLNTVGITLPGNTDAEMNSNTYPEGTYTVGAYITDSKIENSNKTLIPDIQANQINDMQKKFVNNVFYMGIASTLGINENSLLSRFPITNEDVMTVEEEIEFNNIVNTNEITSEGEKVILNRDSNKTVVILKEDDDSRNSLYSDEKYVKINATKETNERGREIHKVSGLIITAGNVIIDGDVEFTGAIIANGNMDCINSTNTIKINKDLTLVRKLIAKYYNNNLKDVIKKHNGLNVETINVNTTEVMDGDESFSVKSYITKGSWTIENTKN